MDIYLEIIISGNWAGTRSFLKGSPQVGLEPTTNRLTADRSTTELLRIYLLFIYYTQKVKKNQKKRISRRDITCHQFTLVRAT